MRLPDALQARLAALRTAAASLRGVPTATVIIFVVGLLFFYVLAFGAPADFPRGVIVEIARGESAREVAATLAEHRIIPSAFWFTSIVVLFVGEERVVAGNYFFAEPQSAFHVAWRLARGSYEITPIRVTVPEGATTFDIARIMAGKLHEFDEQEFLALVDGTEGYLFPDTYYLLPTASPQEVRDLMSETFIRRIEPLQGAIERFGKSLHEIVTMASLLEKEARTTTTRRTIAGILWKRLELGMRLQVDATFLYINGKNTYELTDEDLAIDSPYNTYRRAGLPVGPIANPGLDSIEAAVNPIKTPYLYYLADRNGVTYYSRTFAEHVAKKQRYVR